MSRSRILIYRDFRILGSFNPTGNRSEEKLIMSLKFALAAVLFAAALPAVAQPPAASPPSAAPNPGAAIQPAAMAFGQCLQTGMQSVPATLTPEAGANAVIGGCSTQRAALVNAVEAMLATLPADQQAQGRAQLQSRLGEVPTQLAEGIRQQRAAAAAPATPAPAPAH
jgi:hypothetical protein